MTYLLVWPIYWYDLVPTRLYCQQKMYINEEQRHVVKAFHEMCLFTWDVFILRGVMYWRKQIITSKYIHITHSFRYLLIYNGTCFMVATVCHHVCIARITTRSVKRDLVEKVLGKQRNNMAAPRTIMIFCSVYFRINIFIDGISQNPRVGGNKGTPLKCEILRKWGGGR